MSDSIPGCDPSEAYEVVPLDPIRKDRDPHGWWACLCNGIVVRIASERAPLARYASDPDSFEHCRLSMSVMRSSSGLSTSASPLPSLTHLGVRQEAGKE